MKKFSVFIILLFNASISHADFTGTELLGFCKDAVYVVDKSARSTKQYVDSGMCIGYVSGAISAWQHTAMKDKKSLPYSLPEHATMNQLIRVYVKFLEEYPENLHFDGGMLLWFAFIDAFPSEK